MSGDYLRSNIDLPVCSNASRQWLDCALRASRSSADSLRLLARSWLMICSMFFTSCAMLSDLRGYVRSPPFISLFFFTGTSEFVFLTFAWGRQPIFQSSYGCWNNGLSRSSHLQFRKIGSTKDKFRKMGFQYLNKSHLSESPSFLWKMGCRPLTFALFELFESLDSFGEFGTEFERIFDAYLDRFCFRKSKISGNWWFSS